MEVGHINFRTENVARHVAGAYRMADYFNFWPLLRSITTCSTGEAYEMDMLEYYKAESTILFRTVLNIMSFKSFRSSQMMRV